MNNYKYNKYKIRYINYKNQYGGIGPKELKLSQIRESTTSLEHYKTKLENLQNELQTQKTLLNNPYATSTEKAVYTTTIAIYNDNEISIKTIISNKEAMLLKLNKELEDILNKTEAVRANLGQSSVSPLNLLEDEKIELIEKLTKEENENTRLTKDYTSDMAHGTNASKLTDIISSTSKIKNYKSRISDIETEIRKINSDISSVVDRVVRVPQSDMRVKRSLKRSSSMSVIGKEKDTKAIPFATSSATPSATPFATSSATSSATPLATPLDNKNTPQNSQRKLPPLQISSVSQTDMRKELEEMIRNNFQ